MTLERDALKYHAEPKPGKLAVVPTKPCETARDLSLAYSPGVAVPCLAIAENEDDVYTYTAKGNLVAVITNGTAVLGLGNIGPAASKPVMEGKAVLFKAFADIDVFDLELDCKSPDHFIETVVALAPTFGGINLEDIKAPECFYIEEELKKRLDIPVFHDDQHGTAIIAAAALLNALEVTHRSLDKIKFVVSGAGASAIACCRLLVSLGLPKSSLIMCDSVGVIYRGRKDGMNHIKEEFAADTSARSLADAIVEADVFFGLSQKGALSPEMLKAMAPDPIVFAMANPDPEIEYELARATRSDAILATGRSDYPNQVNNVLGFPFIFRGALDVRARRINDEMKLAAVKALAALAKEPVPDSVRKAYGNEDFSFGRDYLIPKPFDPRVFYYVAPAVARAAIESGVARKEIHLGEYTLRLKENRNKGREILRGYFGLARRAANKRIAYPEGDNPKVMKAALMARDEEIAEPILLGKIPLLKAAAQKYELDISGIELLEPPLDPRYNQYTEQFYRAMSRRGFTKIEAERAVRLEHNFSNMMLRNGDVAGVICGVDHYYPSLVKSIFRIVGFKKGVKTAAGLYIVSIGDKLFFLADTSINTSMSSDKLASIAISTAEFAQSMNIVPRIAMLSFSNFGSVHHPLADLVKHATDLVRHNAPHLQVDGEMQADTAVVAEILRESYPFSDLDEPANVLIFPDMQSGNICYKLLQRLGGARVVGPVILGLNAPAYVMQRHATVDEIFNMTTVAVAQATLQTK